MIFPEMGFSGIPLLTVDAIGFYGTHACLFVLCVSLVTLGIYRPAYRDIPGVSAIQLIPLFAAHGINLLLRATVSPSANYFYTFGLEGNVLLETLRTWIPFDLWYIFPVLIPVGIVYAGITWLYIKTIRKGSVRI